jgi:hypothetical protein
LVCGCPRVLSPSPPPIDSFALEGIEIGQLLTDQDIRADRASAGRTMNHGASGDGAGRLAELEAAARHASERFRLYRAKAYGPHPTSVGRLRELERESKRAESRLQAAKTTQGP